MDVSASMAVETVTSDAKSSGRQLMVCGASDKIKEVLGNVNASSAEILTYPTLLEALESAVSIIEDSGKKSPKHDGSSTLSHA
jgi:SulP family sulfate permease